MRRTAVAAVVLSAAVLGGCGADSEPASAPTTIAAATTTTAATDDHSTHAAASTDHGDHPAQLSSESETLRCDMHMPGDRLTAEQAIVTFDAQHVCLAYVTVAEDTPVRWRNDDVSARTLEILDEDEMVIDSVTIAPGETFERSFDTAGIYRFTYSAIEAFTGTVEVQVP